MLPWSIPAFSAHSLPRWGNFKSSTSQISKLLRTALVLIVSSLHGVIPAEQGTDLQLFATSARNIRFSVIKFAAEIYCLVRMELINESRRCRGINLIDIWMR